MLKRGKEIAMPAATRTAGLRTLFQTGLLFHEG